MLGAWGALVLGILALRWIPPPTTAFMLREHIQTGPIQQRWVPAKRIAGEAALAVMAAEDQRFPTHHGFDFHELADAIADGDRGASTLSQQVAKNLFLWPGGGYLRKGIEAVLTLHLELLWGKERILLVYLNVAEFGPGVFGVEAASQRAFGKPASKLGRSEAALLAAVLPNPKGRSIKAPSERVRARQRQIERGMANLGGSAALVEAGVWPAP